MAPRSLPLSLSLPLSPSFSPCPSLPPSPFLRCSVAECAHPLSCWRGEGVRGLHAWTTTPGHAWHLRPETRPSFHPATGASSEPRTKRKGCDPVWKEEAKAWARGTGGRCAEEWGGREAVGRGQRWSSRSTRIQLWSEKKKAWRGETGAEERERGTLFVATTLPT